MVKYNVKSVKTTSSPRGLLDELSFSVYVKNRKVEKMHQAFSVFMTVSLLIDEDKQNKLENSKK
jgi:hypothetical protein